MRISLVTIASSFVLFASMAQAETCDYRPSKLLPGSVGSKVAIGTATTGGVLGGGATVAGFYTLVHSTTGLTMLGSTMAGSSAAGTAGIIAGTGGAVGATGAVLLNPLVWVPALLVGVGGGGYEAFCAFLVDERITEFEDVLKVMQDFEKGADPEYFLLKDDVIDPFIRLKGADDKWEQYSVEKLYIVEGVLLHRDFGPNTKIGRVVFVPNEAAADVE